MHKIISKTRICGLGIELGLPPLFVNANQFLPAARIFPKTIVSDPVEPGGKTRFAAKAADVFVSAHKSFLRQIICKSEIGPGKLAQQTAHTRLMPADQFTEGVLIVIDKDSCDKVRIRELHVWRL